HPADLAHGLDFTRALDFDGSAAKRHVHWARPGLTLLWGNCSSTSRAETGLAPRGVTHFRSLDVERLSAFRHKC
ncbi:MAG TPA: hypothetical protein VGI10_12410, partial [Polyangiaceae bacterium]